MNGHDKSKKKKPINPSACPRPPEHWAKPAAGWAKLNVDGAWREEDGTGGAGMVLRDHNGAIIFASCRLLTSCASALEAEVAACMEGVALTLEWSSLPFSLETDSLVAANMIKETEQNRSPVAAIVGEIKWLLALGRQHVVTHACRSKNKVAHALAQMGRSEPRTAVWIRHGPDAIGALCQQDCNDLL